MNQIILLGDSVRMQYQKPVGEKLADIDPIMEEKIDKYLHSDEARSLLMKPVAKWLKNVSYELEEYTMPICVRHASTSSVPSPVRLVLRALRSKTANW